MSKARGLIYLVKLSERCPRVGSLSVLSRHLCLAPYCPQLLSSFATLPKHRQTILCAMDTQPRQIIAINQDFQYLRTPVLNTGYR